MKKFSCLLFVGIIFLAGCAAQMSTMQKRHIESKQLRGSYKNCFKATMTVLQDQGYIIKNADLPTGMILATKDIEAGAGEQLLGAMFLGTAATKNRVYEVSMTFDEYTTELTNVRFSIQECTYDMAGKRSLSKNIEDPEMFNSIFNNIQTEIKRREAFQGK